MVTVVHNKYVAYSLVPRQLQFLLVLLLLLITNLTTLSNTDAPLIQLQQPPTRLLQNTQHIPPTEIQTEIQTDIQTEIQTETQTQTQTQSQMYNVKFFMYPLPERFWRLFPSSEEKCPKEFYTRAMNSGA